MTTRAKERRSSTRTASHGAAAFASLLVPLDLSPGSERVAERAALLPLARNARLTLLHVLPKRLPRELRGRAAADARAALGAAARSIARALPEGVAVAHIVKVGGAAAEIARHARSARAQLIVMGRGGGRGFRDIFLGSTAERVIRQSQLPVLVVRLPARTPYRRPLVALDLDPAASDVLAEVLRAIPPPRPRMSLVHAYVPLLDGLVYASLSSERAEEYRREHRQQALHDLARLLAGALAQTKESAGGERMAWKKHVRRGTPRTVIPRIAAQIDADLLALGTHGYSGAAHAFLGTVAGDVLREVSCDVLVVPPRGTASGTD